MFGAASRLPLVAVCIRVTVSIEAPNIVFLMSDQHRFDALEDGAHTPNLDRLAAEGARFMSHYASIPSCPGARASIVTGLSPWNHGMLGFGKVAPTYPSDLPAQVAKLGHKTIAIGKNHFGWNTTSDTGVSHGYQVLEIYDGALNIVDDYERWFRKERPGEYSMKSGNLNYNAFDGAPYEFDEYLHPTAWTGNRSIAKLHELANSKEPFFLKVSFHRPHPPYDPPPRWLDKTSVPAWEPAKSDDGWSDKYRDCSWAGDYPWCGEVDHTLLNRSRRAYHASVSFVDEWIGKFLHTLRETGLDSNTFILFSSDHGDMQMDHFMRLKQHAYEGSAHIPMIAWWPKSLESKITIPRGSRIKAVTELRDIFPTFLHLIGGWTNEHANTVDGKPLTWLMQMNRTLPWREWIDLQHNDGFAAEHISWNGLTDGKMKFVYHAKTGGVQLFNLTEDPYERRDLARNQTESAQQIQLWTQRMVEQFEQEQRGPDWTWQGKLTLRRGNCLYNHNFPLGPNCPLRPVRDGLSFASIRMRRHALKQRHHRRPRKYLRQSLQHDSWANINWTFD